VFPDETVDLPKHTLPRWCPLDNSKIRPIIYALGNAQAYDKAQDIPALDTESDDARSKHHQGTTHESDLIHRPGVGTSLGKARVTTRPKQYKSLLYGKVGKAGMMERRPSWLGRGAASEFRSRPASRTCAGLDGAGAY
jgi:hypothetical protein